jgi:predicted metalloprotease with PDZ domain
LFEYLNATYASEEIDSIHLDEIQAAVSRVAGRDSDDFFENYVFGITPLPYVVENGQLTVVPTPDR